MKKGNIFDLVYIALIYKSQWWQPLFITGMLQSLSTGPITVGVDADRDEVSDCNSFSIKRSCLSSCITFQDQERKKDWSNKKEPDQTKWKTCFSYYTLQPVSVLGEILSLKVHLTMFGDIFGCHNCGEGERKSIRHLVGREAWRLLNILQRAGTYPQHKIIGPNCQGWVTLI